MRVFRPPFWIMVLAVGYSFASAVWLFAGEPTDRVRQVVNQVLQILNDPNYRPKEKKRERVDRLKEVVSPLFDFEEMARRALGPHWRQRSPSEQREFVALFKGFLEKIYSDKMVLYDGEKVVFTRESLDKEYADVTSNIVNKKGEEVSVIYRLRGSDGRWKVYDVVVENISVINNYRSQFSRVISNSSYEELVKKIKEKTG